MSRHHLSAAAAATTTLYLLLAVVVAASGFSPPVSYLLTCGASSSVTLSDGRVFNPDNSAAAAVVSSSAADDPLRRYARRFDSRTTYSLPTSSPGSYILRLHFYPFPLPGGGDLSNGEFNVTITGFPLLSKFSVAAKSTVIKEFFLSFSSRSRSLDLTFSPSADSFAFLNALEFFSIPDDLISANTATPVGPAAAVPSVALPVLETLHRVNVGGDRITTVNDTLWRSWIPDEDNNYLFTSPEIARKFVFPNQINFPHFGATRETAPDLVYSTAREMNREDNNSSFNLTWLFKVPSSPSNGYLMRMHFCDIVSRSLNELYFNVYIDEYLASQDVDLSALSENQLASPHYIDFVLGNSSSPRDIHVSVGPSNRSLPTQVNAILNGLEVMRIVGVAEFTGRKKSKRIGFLVGLLVMGVSVVCVLVGLITAAFLFFKRKRKQGPQIQDAYNGSGSSYSRLTELTNLNASPLASLNLQLRIPFQEIRFATNNFDESCQIGFGGFGKVYKGVLRDGRTVAVKRAVRGGSSGQGQTEFHTEIIVLSKIRHRHLVSLIGYCDERSEMILIYEFMERGPFRDHLYGNTSNTSLPWKQRLEICIGAARGLHYLHTGLSEAIIHRDVKSSNILLDHNYVVKVADFGLSRLGSQTQNHVSTSVKGSFGYLDPEYFKTQQLTEKSDVYSFAVVLLEVLCARPAIDSSLPWDQVNLAEWAIKCLKKGQLERIVDPSVRGTIVPGSLQKFGEIIENCLAQYGVDRPSMGDVLWNLEYVLQLQGSSLSRESLEDSFNGPSEVSPSSKTVFKQARIAHRVDYDTSTVGTSQVFSQMIHGEGR